MTPTPQDVNDRLLTVPEAAELLKLSVGTVYHLISQRRIPVLRLSPRCVRFSERALHAWLETLAQPSVKPGNGFRSRF